MFEKHWVSLTDYQIYEVENGRYIDAYNYVPYLEWNGKETMRSVSADRFITIMNGLPVEDPNKADVLAQEEYARLHPLPTLEERLEAAESLIIELLKGGI